MDDAANIQAVNFYLYITYVVDFYIALTACYV